MSAKKTAFYGMFLALALVAGYIEQLIPINLGIPGVKLGLANIVTMLLLYIVGVPAACLISVLRILLSGFLFGSGFAMVYSAAGAAMSMLVMALLKKTKKFSSVGVSVAGGIFHNVGQIIVAMLVLETKALAYYLPILILSGLSDFLDGYIARHYHMVTDFGKVIDPIADKLTQFTVAVVLIYTYSWMWLLLGIIVIKDGMLALGGFYLYEKGAQVKGASWWGKISTAIFDIVAIILVGIHIPDSPISTIMIIVCIILMGLSLVLYAKQLLQMYWECKNEQKTN